MVHYDRLPAASRFFEGELYQKMNEDLQLAGISQRTVHEYLRAVRQLADYCERRPDKITESQLRRYFLYLKNEKQFAYGNQVLLHPDLQTILGNADHDEAATGQDSARSPHRRTGPPHH